MALPAPRPDAPRRQLTLLDSTSIIVGIVIGAGIYKTTPLIAGLVPGATSLMLLWLLGGLIALVGALCYAELATAYPQEGGDYVYLTRAFGRRMGFIFSWAQLWVVRPGSIGLVAYVFADYANKLVPLGREPGASVAYAAGSIGVLTLINVLGVREGKWTQNLLTLAKVGGLMGIFAIALFTPQAAPAAASTASIDPGKIYLAMIFVLFTYGGWNDMAFVAAEVRDPERNLVRALVLGTLAITTIYLLVNLAFLRVLGLDGVRNSQAVAADMVQVRFGPAGARAISGLICISCLGTINGMIFTGARLYYALGRQHRLFSRFGAWNPRFDAPLAALLLQAVITLTVVIGFGVYADGFRRMVIFTTPVFWSFFLLTGLSLFVLRRIDPGRPRPYRAFGYPVIPILFCFSCLFMLYASVDYALAEASWEAGWAALALVVGFGLSFLDREAA